MKTYTDKELADFMLEARQNNGRTPSWSHFKRHGKRVILFIGIMVVLFGLGAFAQSWLFCGFIFGLVVGIFSRDRAHVRQQEAVWPFYVKVVDWSNVEQIARGEPPG